MKKFVVPLLVIFLASALAAAPLANAPINLNAADGQKTLTAVLVDSGGNPLTLTGYNFLWGFSDNGSILAVNGPLANGGSIPVTPVASGTVTVNVQAQRSGSNVIVTGTTTVNVTGAPASIVITVN